VETYWKLETACDADKNSKLREMITCEDAETMYAAYLFYHKEKTTAENSR
jgi:hypothetical protein